MLLTKQIMETLLFLFQLTPFCFVLFAFDVSFFLQAPTDTNFLGIVSYGLNTHLCEHTNKLCKSLADRKVHSSFSFWVRPIVFHPNNLEGPDNQKAFWGESNMPSDQAIGPYAYGRGPRVFFVGPGW